MDFQEASLVHEFSEELANTSLDSEDSLVSWDSQINDSVIKSGILIDHRRFDTSFSDFLLFLLIVFTSATDAFSSLIENQGSGIIDLERKDGNGSINNPELVDLELHLLGAALNSGLWNSDCGVDFNDGFFGDTRSEADHGLGDGGTDGEHTLNGGELVSKDKESNLTFASGSMKSCSHNDLLTCKFSSNGFNFGELFSVSEFWVALTSIKFSVSVEVLADIFSFIFSFFFATALSLCKSCGFSCVSGVGSTIFLFLGWKVS